MVFQYLESTLHVHQLLLRRTNLIQAFRLSGTTFVKLMYAKWVNLSIGISLSHVTIQGGRARTELLMLWDDTCWSDSTQWHKLHVLSQQIADVHNHYRPPPARWGEHVLKQLIFIHVRKDTQNRHKSLWVFSRSHEYPVFHFLIVSSGVDQVGRNAMRYTATWFHCHAIRCEWS